MRISAMECLVLSLPSAQMHFHTVSFVVCFSLAHNCIWEQYCSLCFLTSTLHFPPPDPGTAECMDVQGMEGGKNPG